MIAKQNVQLRGWRFKIYLYHLFPRRTSMAPKVEEIVELASCCGSAPSWSSSHGRFWVAHSIRATKTALPLLVAILLTPSTATAQAPALSAHVKEGLQAYEDAGAEGAIGVWLRWWNTAGDSVARGALLNSLREVEVVAGQLVGHDPIAVVPIGAALRREFVLILYERRPLFAVFDVYGPYDATGRIVNVSWNLAPQDVWPSILLAPR